MERRNAWLSYKEAEETEIETLAKAYREFLDKGKTERECIALTIERAEAAGYKNIKDVIKSGEKVQAGDILGFMGDTGYGEEGTVGAFPVHLHLGIYICTANFEELSVNPYWILKAAQKKIRKYTY